METEASTGPFAPSSDAVAIAAPSAPSAASSAAALSAASTFQHGAAAADGANEGVKTVPGVGASADDDAARAAPAGVKKQVSKVTNKQRLGLQNVTNVEINLNCYLNAKRKKINWR
jgi:hypothetical protein